MLSAHHASNETGIKQGRSSKIAHDCCVVLGVPSHIGLTILSRTQTFALDQKD
ncbi:conserved hypothetical protein [Vibrio aestuarianus]|uniref:Uncharacterized protein n=1 Tax=Vibrio aestuarianus TaxID=28171 RepID=A0ABM9FTS3_9VIBR|nr:conserved hypothetical protein [Vibrio aestuarianus]CAH8213499.1 conserved hypothetical protein [Vibrio aestuarianus subsp. francensis]CAH8209984.1 conserved hypothetical protein [Vibrio aestuarianus]CAH8214540.1 conserved hypothetical protein [Vibrio aestuarianus]CAH8214751.1 conserved hypothetical protein [Vibrio aestuarianus]